MYYEFVILIEFRCIFADTFRNFLNYNTDIFFTWEDIFDDNMYNITYILLPKIWVNVMIV